ncbi:hypothetical protein HK405_012184, partial [Cladochytrium tenue]
VAIFIVQKILLDDMGLNYICQTYERFYAVGTVLSNMVAQLVEQQSVRLLKHVIRCYLRLSENPRAREALRQCLPDPLRDATFIQLIKDDITTKRCLQSALYFFCIAVGVLSLLDFPACHSLAPPVVRETSGAAAAAVAAATARTSDAEKRTQQPTRFDFRPLTRLAVQAVGRGNANAMAAAVGGTLPARTRALVRQSPSRFCTPRALPLAPPRLRYASNTGSSSTGGSSSSSSWLSSAFAAGGGGGGAKMAMRILGDADARRVVTRLATLVRARGLEKEFASSPVGREQELARLLAADPELRDAVRELGEIAARKGWAAEFAAGAPATAGGGSGTKAAAAAAAPSASAESSGAKNASAGGDGTFRGAIKNMFGMFSGGGGGGGGGARSGSSSDGVVVDAPAASEVEPSLPPSPPPEEVPSARTAYPSSPAARLLKKTRG